MLPNKLALPNLEALQTLARKLSRLVKKGDVIALRGTLGTGKTECARALLRELGVKGDIASPTFTLVQTYEIPGLLVSHFDLYRIKSPIELDELGWDDALADGLALIEWPERAGDRIPDNRLEIEFEITPGSERCCLWRAYGDRSEKILSTLQDEGHGT